MSTHRKAEISINTGHETFDVDIHFDAEIDAFFVGNMHLGTVGSGATLDDAFRACARVAISEKETQTLKKSRLIGPPHSLPPCTFALRRNTRLSLRGSS